MIDDARAAARREVTAAGPFAVAEELVLGERMPVFTNRHRNLREMLQTSARFGDTGYFTLGDHTLTFAANLSRAAATAAALRCRLAGNAAHQATRQHQHPIAPLTIVDADGSG